MTKRDWVSVTEQFSLFAEFMTVAWSVVTKFEKLSRESSFLDDWMESSWEQLVEASIKLDSVLLVPYAPSDMHTKSSRIFRPDLAPTHEIRCLADGPVTALLNRATGSMVPVPEDGFEMGELVGEMNGGFTVHPPFTHLRIEQGHVEFVFELAQLTFWVKPVAP